MMKPASSSPTSSPSWSAAAMKWASEHRLAIAVASTIVTAGTIAVAAVRVQRSRRTHRAGITRQPSTSTTTNAKAGGGISTTSAANAAPSSLPPPDGTATVRILFGSCTGTAELLAKSFTTEARRRGFPKVACVDGDQV